jgi:hypothetical protein
LMFLLVDIITIYKSVDGLSENTDIMDRRIMNHTIVNYP